MIDLFLEFWPVLTVVIGVIVWLVRLEGQAMANAKEISRLYKRRDEDLHRAEQDQQETSRKLDRIEDTVKQGLATLTEDIKRLLAREK